MSAKNPNIQTLKYRVSATISKLRLSTKSPLNLKVQWKRNETSAETPLILHKNQSSFAPLILQFNVYYDSVKREYVEKKTDFNVVIERDGVVKSGGTVRVDIVEALNRQQLSNTIKMPLTKCPDTSAFLEIVLNFELLSEGGTEDMSVADMSMTNTSFQGFSSQSSISSSNFLNDKMFELPQSNKPTKDKPQPGQLTVLVDKFQGLLGRLKTNGRGKVLDRSNTSSVRGEKQELNDRIQELEEKNRTLERQVDKKSTEILDKGKEINRLKEKVKDLEEKIDPSTMNDDYEYKFRELEDRFNRQSEELQELKDSNSDQVIKELEDQRYQLQDQIAKISRNMGKLFDAAFEIGGAHLLDSLQGAIGLIQS